jgi:hypothetical protein
MENQTCYTIAGFLVALVLIHIIFEVCKSTEGFTGDAGLRWSWSIPKSAEQDSEGTLAEMDVDRAGNGLRDN